MEEEAEQTSSSEWAGANGADPYSTAEEETVPAATDEQPAASALAEASGDLELTMQGLAVSEQQLQQEQELQQNEQAQMEQASREQLQHEQQNEHGEEDAFVAATLQSQVSAVPTTQAPYQHPKGCRAYLTEQVTPLLREGLLALVEEMQQQRLHLAAGTGLDDGQYLPRGWAPFSPMRWLAEWLLAHSPYATSDTSAGPGYGATVDDEEDAGGEEAAVAAAHRMLGELSHEQALALLFDTLDAAGTGSLRPSAVAEAAHVLLVGTHAEDQVKDLDHLLAVLGAEPDAPVRQAPFIAAFSQLTADLSDDEFLPSLRHVLSASSLAYCHGRREKLALLFRRLDTARQGYLSPEVLTAVAAVLDPDASEAQLEERLASALSGLAGTEEGQAVRIGPDEFDTAMRPLLAATPGVPGLDDRLFGLILAPGATHRVPPAEEVEPHELSLFVMGLPSHRHALQISATRLLDLLSSAPQSLVLLDVRSAEERAVSGLPGAVPCPVQEDAAAEHGYSLDSDALKAAEAAVAEALQRSTADNETPPQPVHIIAHCSTGARGNAAALLLSQRLRRPVRNLCGGLISYYNVGGHMHDASGAHVQSLHPGDAQGQAFLTRHSKYSLKQ